MRKRIGVFVMGSLDRSPRMLNHALSLAEFTELDIDFIGYEGSSMPIKLDQFRQIHLKYIDTSIIDTFKKAPKVFYLLYAFIRIFVQTFQLFCLVYSGNYDYILM
jgi:hypothetical protein